MVNTAICLTIYLLVCEGKANTYNTLYNTLYNIHIPTVLVFSILYIFSIWLEKCDFLNLLI